MSLQKKCFTCKFWYPNTEQGVLEEVDRRLKYRCSRLPDSSNALVGCRNIACGRYKKLRPFYMVPWDGKTWIKVYADSEKELMQKTMKIVNEVAGKITDSILNEMGVPK